MRLRLAPVEYKVCSHCASSRETYPDDVKGRITDARDLAEGTLVIHADYGIGKFSGIISLNMSGTPEDFLCVEYAEGAKIYVPGSCIGSLSRYMGGDQPPLTTLSTAGEYEGDQCPVCRRPFDRQTMRKVIHDRLILVGMDVPVYEQAQRCRCPACRNVYDLSELDITAHAKCAPCGQPLFCKPQLKEIWRDAQTRLQRARKLDRARRKLTHCTSCTHPVDPVCWCSHSRAIPHPTSASGLPQKPLAVWVRTFAKGTGPHEGGPGPGPIAPAADGPGAPQFFEGQEQEDDDHEGDE